MLYLVGAAYFWLALWVDRYNLLRHVAPPPRTGPSLTMAMAAFVFPLSIVLHVALVGSFHGIVVAGLPRGQCWTLRTSA